MLPAPINGRYGQISDTDRETIIRALTPLFAGRDIRLCLFGSCARGDASDHSDVDLAVVSSRKLPADLLADMRETLEEAPVPFRADVVDYQSADPVLRQAIDREGIVWIA